MEARRATRLDASELDFRQDRADWQSLSHETRLPILAYVALFASGTEFDLSQSSRLTPLILGRNRVNELQCFTTLLAEKASFHDLYVHVISNVTGMVGDPERFFNDAFRAFMFEWLTGSVDRALECRDDDSLLQAIFALSAVTEGVLALTGYSIVARTLERLDVMPTLLERVRFQAERTESHVEFGYHIIEQLISEAPSTRATVKTLADTAFAPSVTTVREVFSEYATSAVPSTEAVALTLKHLAKVDARLQSLAQPKSVALFVSDS
jgi:ribonucleotide reductase beta subunit family protein with ferritin-like domain